MKNEVYFDNVKNIGRLYLEYIFLEFEMDPILFTCVDDKERLFLCLCSEIRSGQKWIITQCELETLKKLILGEIDIASAMSMEAQLTVIEMDIHGNESSNMIRRDELDPLDLPKEGTLLRCNQKDAMNYFVGKNLSHLLLQLSDMIDYVSSYYKKAGEINANIYSTKLLNQTNCSQTYPDVGVETPIRQNGVFQLKEKYRALEPDIYCAASQKADMENFTNDYLFAA